MTLDFSFQLLNKSDIGLVVPMIHELSSFKVSKELLLQRMSEMVAQNYQCAVILSGEQMIGVCGMWFSTRHYSGKSMEIDHVFIKTEYRNQGLGKRFMNWIDNYAKSLGGRSYRVKYLS